MLIYQRVTFQHGYGQHIPRTGPIPRFFSKEKNCILAGCIPQLLVKSYPIKRFMILKLYSNPFNDRYNPHFWLLSSGSLFWSPLKQVVWPFILNSIQNHGCDKNYPFSPWLHGGLQDLFLPVPHKAVAEVSKIGKPIGEVGCCESGMAEWILMERKVIDLSHSFSLFLWLSTYLPIYLLCIYLSIDLYIYIYLSLSLSSVYLSSRLPVYLSIYLSVYLSTCLSVVQCHSV